MRSPSLEALEAALEAMVQGGEQLSAEQLSHAQGQLSGERVRRGEASAAAKAQLEAAAAQLAAAETEANTAAQAREHLSYHTFYGIVSYQCMEATTPSLACANKCVFCWPQP